MRTLNHLRSACTHSDYAAVLLMVRVRNARFLPTFVAGIPPIIDQAGATDGMICFGFDIDWPRLIFTTFAVAREAEVLQTFARSGEHGRLTAALAGRVGPLTVGRFTLPGAAVPRTWQDVEALTSVTEPAAGAR